MTTTHKTEISFEVKQGDEPYNAEMALTAMCHYLDQSNLSSKMWIVDALGRLAMELWEKEEAEDMVMRSLARGVGKQ